MNTLLLNASYEPLTVVSWKMAVNLVVQGKADVIHEGPEMIHYGRGEMPRPSVVRLRYFVKVPYRARIPLNRRSVLARDKHQCQFTHCERKGTTIDHVVPRSKGGQHTWENVAAACRPCNFKKADKSMREMGWSLRRESKAPQGRYLLIGHQAEPEWMQYLEPKTD